MRDIQQGKQFSPPSDVTHCNLDGEVETLAPEEIARLLQIRKRYESLSKGLDAAIYGVIRHTREALLIDLCDDFENALVNKALNVDLGNNSPIFADQIADLVAQSIKDGDAHFFSRLGKVLKLKQLRGSFLGITLRDIGRVHKRGRPEMPYDLGTVVPMAVCRIIDRRDPTLHVTDEFTNQRISRKELLLEIQKCQQDAGNRNAPPISNSQLSREITKAGLKPFMENRGLRKRHLKG